MTTIDVSDRIRMAEKELRKSPKMTLKQFPDRETHINLLNEYIERTKRGVEPSRSWQLQKLTFAFEGSPTTEAAPVVFDPESVAQAIAWDGSKNRHIRNGDDDITAAQKAWESSNR